MPALPERPADDEVAIASSPPTQDEYRRDETSLLTGPDVSILASSDGFGWNGVYAALTDERPHEGFHRAIPDLWLVTTLQGIDLNRTVGERSQSGSLPAHRVSIAAPDMSLRDTIASSTTALHVYLKADVVREVADELFPGHRADQAILPAFCAEDPILLLYLHAVRSSLYEPSGSNALKLEYLQRAMATHLLQRHSTDAVSSRALAVREGLGSRQLREVLGHIEGNLGNGITINDLASIARVSRVQFMRRFKASTRRTPYQYVMEERIRRARALLANPKLELADIAIVCGFSSQAHFSTVFKRFTGVSPTTYRQSVA